MKDIKTNSVLVVDDSTQNIDALRSILDELYTVYVAKNGETALKIVERSNPDIILLDVMMPGMDGFEVLEHIKANKKHANIPILFVTGETDSFSEGRGLMLGAVDYVTKPYNKDIVSIKVRNHLENKMNRDSLEKIVEQRTRELSSSREAIIMGMSLLAEGRDQGTGMHLQRIKRYTEIIATKYHEKYPSELTMKGVGRMILLSSLHDIGKVHISDTILLKRGPLTYEEFSEMKKHTLFGADVLEKTQALIENDSSNILKDAVFIAKYHHEKYDGSGYPEGIKGDEIPLSAKIVALADVYDALTSKREYKDAFSHERAANIILIGDGRTSPDHFDPKVLAIFKEELEEFKKVN